MPKRRLRLFFLDGTKQLLSNSLLHFSNLFFSVILGSTTTDQCGIYLMSFVVDITLGTALCYYLLKVLDRFLEYRKAKARQFNVRN